MKLLFAILLMVLPTWAQNGGSRVLDFGSGTLTDQVTVFKNHGGDPFVIHNVKYTWEILRNPDGSKTFKYIQYGCEYGDNIPLPDGSYFLIPYFIPVCKQQSESDVSPLAPVQTAMAEFYDLAPSVPHTVVYGPFAIAEQARATVQPNLPASPKLIFFDGLSNSLVKFDLATFSPISQVTVPDQAAVFGILPTPEQDVVWQFAYSGTVPEIVVVDLTAKRVTSTIPLPSLVVGNSVPVGIVFTNSGATALFAVSYYTPDTAGSKGALLAFDVATRTLKSTLQLSFTPSKLLMAPDGLTAYLLGDDGTILYYDVFSGTADLKANTSTPGVASGFASSGQAFLHPDGTRLFWNANYLAYSWDLTTRKLIATFNSGISSSAGATMQMAQDGSTLTLLSGAGDAVVMDSSSGYILAKYSTAPTAAILFPGLAIP